MPFWNRKYFMLLLIYVLIMTYLNTITEAYDFYLAIKWGFDTKYFSSSDPKLAKNVIIILAFIMNFTIMCLMTAFLKFHLMLVT